jgi:hypothetical protein
MPPLLSIGADPERRVVVDKPNLHVIRRRRALDGLGLEKIGDRARPLPGLVVEAPVESNRTGLDSNGLRLFTTVGSRFLPRDCRRRAHTQQDQNK